MVNDTHIVLGSTSNIPLNISNFNYFNSVQSKEMKVYNKIGEYSALRKNDNYKVLTDEKMSDLANKYISEVYPIEELEFRDLRKMGVAESNEPYRIHEFWKKHASELGLEYETNYSCLK